MRVVHLPFLRDAPQALGLVVGFVPGDELLAPARRAQEVRALGIDGEKAHRRTVLRRHVGNRRTIHHRQRCGARPEIFDEFADDLRLAQQLREREGDIGRRDAFLQRAGQVHAHDVGREEINRLAEHAGLGLDTADAPAHDAQAVDHRRVRIGPDERIRIEDARLLAEHALREILQIDLMDDSDAGRHDLKRVEGLHAPFQKLVALAIALKLQIEVLLKRRRAPRKIHLHGVVHDEIDRHQRLDDLRIFAQALDRRAHRGQIDEQRHAGEILEHDSCDDKRHLLGPRRIGLPPGEGFHRMFCHTFPIAVSEQRLQHQPDRNR